MLPAEFFKLTEPLQVGFHGVPDDIVALYKTVQTDLTWIGCPWITLHATIVKQAHACRQCNESFSTDQIFVSKTMYPIELHELGVLLLADDLRRCSMGFQHHQPRVMNLLCKYSKVLLPTAKNH